MEELPSSVVLDILSRLSDPADLGRCRLVSTALRSLSYEVPTLSFLCTARRRGPRFKPRVARAVSSLRSLRSLSLSARIEPSADEAAADDDDMHLMDGEFLDRWLRVVGAGMGSLEISDYWAQSCWRKSDALAVISDHCGNLQNLVLRNAWLSVDRLRPMQKLTALTLEFIRLDDENLDKMSECFPSLEVLNLIGVGGLKEPKIRLSCLRVCKWTVSNFPHSLTIHTPKLTVLHLQCVEPRTLVLEAPLLSELDLNTRRLGRIIDEGGLCNLKSVRLQSPYPRSLMELLTSNESVCSLELKVSESEEETVDIMDLVSAFPNVQDLKLDLRAWFNLQSSSARGSMCRERGRRSIERLTIHLPPTELDVTFLSAVLSVCVPYCKVLMLIHCDASIGTRESVIYGCTGSFPDVLWQWGFWK